MASVKDCLVIITWYTKVTRVKRGRDYNLIISKAFWSVVSMLNESFMFSTSFPALSLWAAQEVVFDEAIWRSWRGLVWGKLSYSWRIGVRLILLLLYSPPPTSIATTTTKRHLFYITHRNTANDIFVKVFSFLIQNIPSMSILLKVYPINAVSMQPCILTITFDCGHFS